jgi:putative membrane protein
MDDRARTDEGGGARGMLLVYLKGLCMGAADAVPGVSGGTIALIVGVYERLIAALTALDPRALRHLRRLHTRDGRRTLARALVAMDVPFLAALGLGVVTAVAAMSGVMHTAVTEFPAVTYAFFFGLIAASAVVLRDELRLSNLRGVTAAVAGFSLAFLVSGVAASGDVSHSLLVVFLSGTVAISAMILPGVSGSFILLLLGQYEYLTGAPGGFLDAVVAALGGDTADLLPATTVVVAFVGGAVVGLLTISHAVNYALTNYRRATLTFLVALIVGALRAPALEVTGAVSAWTPTAAGSVVIAAGVGAVLVFVLDYTTDDLDY